VAALPKAEQRISPAGEQPQPAAEGHAQLQTEERETAAEFPKAAPRILPAGVHPLSDAEPSTPERTVRVMT
ncbi:hypothetical protein, partial [Citrobacter portucalensis]|uniref:hypothetical protein n=1 Tax=Citrobacter portucalensis TaxID=1639133 RepID=UPI00226B9B57